MNVYDFDKTIYRGDSSVDFYLFCLKRRPILIRFLPRQAMGALRYALGVISKKEWKEAFFCFLSAIDTAGQSEAFRQAKQGKISLWFLAQKKADDVVISASPDFLLRPICESLGITHLIASRVDADGRFIGENCRGEEKCRRFRAEFPDGIIDEFYSDSLSDLPMAAMAQKAFLVKNGVCRNWNLSGTSPK